MVCVFFFNDTATTEIYTLSLHDALPICRRRGHARHRPRRPVRGVTPGTGRLDETARHAAPLALGQEDRKSTRLNSSHANISYAVFCLKKKKIKILQE